MSGAFGYSLTPLIRKSRYWNRVFTRVATWYVDISGYRRVGLKFDDLLIEETPEVQKALSRLPKQVLYDRAYRMRIASQCSLLHKDLPQDQWIKPEDDVPYLTPYIEEVIREQEERKHWDTIQVVPKQH